MISSLHNQFKVAHPHPPSEISVLINKIGAHAYYLHSVLHDWPDDKCQEVLKNIIPSMKKGYSKILINENIIPDRDADWQMTSLDFVMMSCFSSKERTAADWRKLLDDVGLKVVKIWTYENGSESLIEAELA